MKGIVVVAWFFGGMLIASHAAVHNVVVGIALGASMMGGAIGYLVGRVDLRKELGLPRS